MSARRILIAGLVVTLILPAMALAQGDIFTVLVKAGKVGNISLIRLYIRDDPKAVRARDARGDTPLHIAAIWGFYDIAKLLIDKGADVNAVDDGHRAMPLHFAAFNGRVKIAALLLKHGARINAPENMGRTPLHIAAGRGFWNVVEFLLKKCARTDIKDERGRTPLSMAVEKGRKYCVKLIRRAVRKKYPGCK